MLDAFQIVLTLLIMMLVGYGFSAKGYINQKVADFISKLVVWVGVPATAFDNMLNNFSQEMLRSAGIGLLVPFLIVGLSFFLAASAAKLLKVRKGRRGVFAVMCACSNTIFIGLPVNLALFGDAAAPYVLLYDMGHTLLFWTLGAYFMQKDKLDKDGSAEHAKISLLSILKKILSPGLIALLLSMLLVMLDMQLPLFFMKTAKYFGNLCTPLSLIFIGQVMQKIGLKNLRIEKDSWGILLARFLFVPAITFGIVTLLGTPFEMNRVFIAQAAMPVMSSTAIISAAYGSDSDFASKTMALTTLCSFLVIPLLSVVSQALFG